MPVHRSFRVRPRARRRSRRRRLSARVVAGLGAALVMLTASSVSAGGQAADPPPHVPPVDAPVADGFRPPTHPYGPGNRGIEYDTEPGAEVRASAAGEVVFAGVVAGSRHVTLRHADGIRTSYSYLDQVHVLLGQRVEQGQPIGIAGERLHFGARRGDAYFDPATLFHSPGQVEVELIPFEVPPGTTSDEERAALLLLAAAEGGGGFGIGLPSLGDVASWVVRRAPLVRHYTEELDPMHRGLDLATAVATRLGSPEACSDQPAPSRPAHGEDRLAILVGGLGSTSRSASIDRLRIDELGYRREDIVRFSYAGGRTPEAGAAVPGAPTNHYDSAHTQVDIEDSARLLADLVEDAAAARPDAAVDLYAHSMGGLVTRLALDELDRRGVDLERIGLVTTFGTPHQGADLATAVASASTTLPGHVALDAATEALDTGLDPQSPAVAQLAETSSTVASLQESGVPEGIELVSLAASGDIVVAAPNTTVPGARNVTVTLSGDHAHGDLVASDESTSEVARALAGQPAGCEDPWEVATEELTGHGISYAEDVAGLALLYAGD
ncbi:MAG: peptidoglycan DD-metalloendopeptidase family protein [Acidimicrobiales bacterium]